MLSKLPNFVRPDEEVVGNHGYHICMYINDFEKTYTNAKNFQLNDHTEVNCVWHNPRFPTSTFETLDSCLAQDKEFRIKDVLDVDTGEVIYQLEWEVRALEHKSFSFPFLR